MTAKIHLRYARELAEESNIAGIAEAGSLWGAIRHEVKLRADFEPIMSTFFHAPGRTHETFEGAPTSLRPRNLYSPSVSPRAIPKTFEDASRKEPAIIRAAEIDIKAVRSRDPACNGYSTPLLFYKGFHALQSHRVAHWLWGQERHSLAFYLQNQMSAIFGVDIHPAAQIGCGIMLDHATSIVIGETAVVEDDVTMLHGVTLGGTGKESGDRHPKVRHGVLIGASASIIGNIEIGEGAKVGAGSVVMKDVPPHVTVAGVPAEVVGRPKGVSPAEDVDQSF